MKQTKKTPKQKQQWECYIIRLVIGKLQDDMKSLQGEGWWGPLVIDFEMY